jgi:hypothetical protein
MPTMAQQPAQSASGAPSPEDCMPSMCQFFGASAYYAQRFESALKDFLLILAELAQDPKFDFSEKNLDRNTMGTVLRKLRDVVSLRGGDWIDKAPRGSAL